MTPHRFRSKQFQDCVSVLDDVALCDEMELKDKIARGAQPNVRPGLYALRDGGPAIAPGAVVVRGYDLRTKFEGYYLPSGWSPKGSKRFAKRAVGRFALMWKRDNEYLIQLLYNGLAFVRSDWKSRFQTVVEAVHTCEMFLADDRGEFVAIREGGREVKRHASPTHPGTGSSQDVHAGNGRGSADGRAGFDDKSERASVMVPTGPQTSKPREGITREQVQHYHNRRNAVEAASRVEYADGTTARDLIDQTIDAGFTVVSRERFGYKLKNPESGKSLNFKHKAERDYIDVVEGYGKFSRNYELVEQSISGLRGDKMLSQNVTPNLRKVIRASTIGVERARQAAARSAPTLSPILKRVNVAPVARAQIKADPLTEANALKTAIAGALAEITAAVESLRNQIESSSVSVVRSRPREERSVVDYSMLTQLTQRGVLQPRSRACQTSGKKMVVRAVAGSSQHGTARPRYAETVRSAVRRSVGLSGVKTRTRRVGYSAAEAIAISQLQAQMAVSHVQANPVGQRVSVSFKSRFTGGSYPTREARDAADQHTANYNINRLIPLERPLTGNEKRMIPLGEL